MRSILGRSVHLGQGPRSLDVGRICLQSAITWGLMSLLLVYLIDPVSIRLSSAIPRPADRKSTR